MTHVREGEVECAICSNKYDRDQTEGGNFNDEGAIFKREHDTHTATYVYMLYIYAYISFFVRFD